ncbi:helix-turn-helix domain-containing protein [Sphaerimonospora mesophila]|uniref:helix-turn-helix domain-containing protein n=1 Tax=Sphaerimonospora mesophila TaxID=37483 RepID=UPI0009F9A05A
MIHGERVRQLRGLHGMTQAELVKEIPYLTQSQLSRIESGLAQPDEETVALLAAIFGVTTELFKRPPIADLTAHSPQMRARGKLTSRDKASGLEWARLIEEFYLTLQSRAKIIPTKLTQLHEAAPQEAAQEVRSLLGFNPIEPLPYLILAIERIGVTVLGLPYRNDALDAFSAWRDDRPIIAILSGVPGDRVRFNVAHELGHLVLHSRRPIRLSSEIEAEADQFAAALLTPLHAIRHEMPKNPTLSSLAMLKTQWGVSIKSLVRRARELGVIDQERAISLYKQISARGWNRAEPGYVAQEKPRAFRKLAEISYGPGPNTEKMATEACWSEELTLAVLEQHATVEELPFQSPPRLVPVINTSKVVALKPQERKRA